MRDMDSERQMQKIADEAQPKQVRESWRKQISLFENSNASGVDIPGGKRAFRAMRTHCDFKGKPSIYSMSLGFISERNFRCSDVPPWCSPRTGKAKKVKS